MSAITIKGLVKKYGKCVAVDGLDLEIEEGELFALLGENGAGKTTTIKVLCSLCGYDDGEIKILGYDNKTEKEEIKRIVNLSPQENAVANNLTVLENLNLICDLYGVTDKSVIEKTVEKFRLSEVINKRAKTLSGGYARRLSLAMALITNPKILFLDEPTLGLDVKFRRELWKIIGELKGKLTVILTTHYIEEAEALSDRIGIMKEGKLLTVGTAEELKTATGKEDIEEAFLTITGDME